jgi:hypothetical protein
VWGIGNVDDGVNLGAHMLATMHKEWQIWTLDAVTDLVEGTLPMGRDRLRGLTHDYAVGLEMSYALPAHLESAVIDRCSELRAGASLSDF